MSRRRICIISLSLPIETDIRLIKQIEFLAPHFHLHVIGYGNPERVWDHLSTWHSIDRAENRLRQLFERGLIFAGRLSPRLYDVWYWQRPRYQQALAYARANRVDAFLADDWAAIPIAKQAADRGQPIVFDADEYWPGEVESSHAWKLFFSPLITHIMHRSIGAVTASATVSNAMAYQYRAQFKIDPIIIYNAPKYVEIHQRNIDPDHVRLVHQGSPIPNHRLETLIEALALADRRYTLHLMLTGAQNDSYLLSLKHLAEERAPGRVTFHPPVYPTDIVQTIAQYDIGISVIPPATMTYKITLPNKIFESIVAGQAVIVGPSPAMAELVQQYGVGCVTADFGVQALADTLNGLTTEQINAMRRRAHTIAKTLNAEVELAKLVNLFSQLLANKHAS